MSGLLVNRKSLFDIRFEEGAAEHNNTRVSTANFGNSDDQVNNHPSLKKMMKELQVDIVDSEDENKELSPKSAKRKAKRKKSEQDNKETPKFGPLSLNLAKAVPSQHSEGQNNLKTDLRPTEAETLSFQLNENEPGAGKPSESIVNHLSFVKYLRNKKVPIGNKLFYLLVSAMIAIGCVINVWDLAIYTNTPCSDFHSRLPVYFNFFMLLVVKGGIFKCFTAEVSAELQYDLKFPFLIPILTTGVVANLQLPLIIYDYKTCELRSSLFRMSFGYFFLNVLSLVLVFGIVCAVFCFLLLDKCNFPNLIVKLIKTIYYFIVVCGMMIMNALFMFITFTQIKHLPPSLLIENILYWVLVLSGTIIFLLRKKWSLEVFARLDTLPEEQKAEGEQTPRLAYDDSKKEPSLVFKNYGIFPGRTVLEKIDEREIESERSSGSGPRMEERKDLRNDVVVSIGGGNFKLRQPAVHFRGVY